MLRPYLLTPVLNPQTRGDQLYNESHIRTRNSIERLFGVWKRRFPVLAYGLRCKLETVMIIITAVGVLHNIAIDAKEEEPPVPADLNLNQLNYLIQAGQLPDVPNLNEGHEGIHYRSLIINSYFANM